ncbi:right-handed parallel beta-helix repeat-containing protein [Lysobacter enzymogenes]|uniref:right-handed parallel beta-helix repeat-containing protein n=1 Tax=Lysobacter enzymogenes TaxID=69 RepID=UPI00089CE8CD|nr:right-handed parallel beta-helix repeat-containing protein [Lysobacter enzymogenes]SDX62399.1 Right handed beta helix region [Lysobacter enzymogenes]
MRHLANTGLALAGLLLSANALACDTILPPTQVGVHLPGKYCLSANRSLPIEIDGADIELDCRSRTLASAQPGNSETGIRVRGGNKVVVRNCRIEGFAVGIFLEARSGAQLLNNTVLRAQFTPIVARGEYFQGGPIDPQIEPVRIVGNRVIGYGQGGTTNPGAALIVQGLPRATISNNVVAGFSGPTGLELVESPDAQLTGNQFLDFSRGDRLLRLQNSPRARIVHNTIMSRQPTVFEGLSGATDATCVENVFINTVRSGFADCAVARYNVEQQSPM